MREASVRHPERRHVGSPNHPQVKGPPGAASRSGLPVPRLQGLAPHGAAPVKLDAFSSLGHYSSSMSTLEDRLDKKLDRSGTCWVFTGCTDINGYGMIWDGRRRNNSKAHRIAYEVWVGEIPLGHDVHHRCRVRACCRPDHLEAIPSAMHNGMHHLPHTHCAQGHPFTGLWRQGQQVCRVCARAATSKWAKANRARINERRRQRYAAARRA